MALFTTSEMHEAMVHWQFEYHKIALEISQLANCSEQTVYDILHLHQDYGQVHPHMLNNGDVEYIHALTPDYTWTSYKSSCSLHKTKMYPLHPFCVPFDDWP
jgi:Fe2+ or Zn2+ uptake regulation protein